MVDAAQCGPLWSAPSLAGSEQGDTPRSQRGAATGVPSPAELALLQAAAQAHVSAQAHHALQAAAGQPPAGAASMLPAAEGSAAQLPALGSACSKGLHRQRRSLDISWLARKLEGDALEAGSGAAAVPLAAPQAPRHGRSRSASLVAALHG